MFIFTKPLHKNSRRPNETFLPQQQNKRKRIITKRAQNQPTRWKKKYFAAIHPFLFALQPQFELSCNAPICFSARWQKSTPSGSVKSQFNSIFSGYNQLSCKNWTRLEVETVSAMEKWHKHLILPQFDKAQSSNFRLRAATICLIMILTIPSKMFS